MNTRKGHVTLDAPLDHIPLHVRGGHIIPAQEPANNTAFRYLFNSAYIPTSVCTYEKDLGDVEKRHFICKSYVNKVSNKIV